MATVSRSTSIHPRHAARAAAGAALVPEIRSMGQVKLVRSEHWESQLADTEALLAG